jgi:hypothetical protein
MVCPSSSNWTAANPPQARDMRRTSFSSTSVRPSPFFCPKAHVRRSDTRMGVKANIRCTTRRTGIPYVHSLSRTFRPDTLADIAVLHDSRILVSGGYDGHVHFGDLHALELASCAYLPQVVSVPSRGGLGRALMAWKDDV